MGLCLSCHCGEAQHKAAVVAVSISHGHSASSPATSRILTKRFLHAYNIDSNVVDPSCCRNSKLSPRPSLELGIPHSSELFSLPSEGSDAETSSSPARASSTSSRPPSCFSGRFSTEKPRNSNYNTGSSNCRKSCSSVLPETTLLETIARLEKLCDVKLFVQARDSSSHRTCNDTTRNELSATTGHDDSTILLHESCRHLAHKLLCFANDQGMKLLEPAPDSECAVQTVKETIMPVASFLTEVEMNSVTSEATTMSRLQTSSDLGGVNHVKGVGLSEMKLLEPAPDSDQTVEEAAAVASFLTEVEMNSVATTMSRLPSLRFQEGDENLQFTDFEATFELLPAEMTSDEADQASMSPEDSALCQPAHQRSWTSSDLGGVNHVKQQKGPKKATLSRPALTDISANAQAEPRKSRQSLKGKRRGSRSLDLQNCSLSRQEFDSLLKSSERWRLTQAETLRREESPRIEAKESQRIEGEDSQAEDSQRIETEESQAEDSQRIEAADLATIQQLAGEGEVNTPSPSPSQLTKGRLSVDGEEEEESQCTKNADETWNVPLKNDIISDKSFSQAFDNLFKLLQSPPGELAQNTAQLLQLLGAKTDDAEFRHPPVCLSTTEQPELLSARYSTTEELECLPERLTESLLTDPMPTTAAI